MKRLCLLAFLLLTGIRGAYVDANSDAFNDASNFGQNNKNQGTSSASGTDPSSVIPGYTPNPSQSSNYGGVRGGDGGIADKGQTSLSQNDAGQAVNDSSTKNPSPKIDPNADFIQNGKNAEANGGSIVDGTNANCSEKVVSKSVFENYSCDRDINQIQTCARTASIQVTGSKETYTTQFVMDARSSSGNDEGDWWVRYDFTVPDDGTLSSGSWLFQQPDSPDYHGGGFTFSMQSLGQSITFDLNNSGAFSIASQHVSKGQVISMRLRWNSSGHNDSYRDGLKKALANGKYVARITLPMTAERDTTSSKVVWTESCPFDKSTATSSAGSQCVDPGGNRTITQNGRDYTQYSDCWQYSDAYVVPVNSTGNCDQLINNRNCTLAGRSCSQSEAGACMHENDTYQCQTTYTSQGLLCGGQYFCRSGDCSDTDGTGDNGFDMSISKLAGLASAGDDVKKGSQTDIRAFTGQPMSCRKAVAGFSNCCVDTGWGNSSGLANCNSEEMAIGKAKAKKVTVYVGDKCDHAVLGVCVQKSQVYCVFGGKLSRIIQEQGRRDQLHVDFGSGDSPNCRGITVAGGGVLQPESGQTEVASSKNTEILVNARAPGATERHTDVHQKAGPGADAAGKPAPEPEQAGTAENKVTAAPDKAEPVDTGPALRDMSSPGNEPIVKPETERGRSRLQARWQRQMDDLGFDIKQVVSDARAREQLQSAPEAPLRTDATEAVREAISVLSDSQTRFTYGDLLVTAFSAGQHEEKIPDLKRALDKVISSGELVPLDADKGVFTSRIHLLDELSLQSVAGSAARENVVASFRAPKEPVPARFEKAMQAPVAILNAPSSALRQRETAEQLVTMSRAHGRDVMVMAASAERALSLGKSGLLKDSLMQRSRILGNGFSLAPQSTLVVDGAEKLSLKEMLVLTGEALEKNAQLLFLDGAGRTAATSALSVLEQSGVPRLSLSEPSPGLAARVISIADKRDRYQALATRYAELSGPEMTLSATVAGEREQQQLNGLIRSALKDAGKLGHEEVSVEARIPVFTTAKTRRLVNTYRPGQVLEDRSDKNETRHYVIDRVHEDTRQLSLIDTDGVVSVQDIRTLTGDWRLFERETLQVSAGEKLFAVAGDKEAGLKARDRLTVESVSEGQITVLRDGQKKPVPLESGRALYLTHAYVAAPGSLDNDRGVVLASLNGRDLTANMMNSLARSGHEAEIFTGEPQARAEDRIERMRSVRTPLSLVREMSGKDDATEAVTALKSGVQTDLQKAFTRAVSQMRDVAFTEVELLKEAMSFVPDTPGLQQMLRQQVADRGRCASGPGG